MIWCSRQMERRIFKAVARCWYVDVCSGLLNWLRESGGNRLENCITHNLWTRLWIPIIESFDRLTNEAPQDADISMVLVFNNTFLTNRPSNWCLYWVDLDIILWTPRVKQGQQIMEASLRKEMHPKWLSVFRVSQKICDPNHVTLPPRKKCIMVPQGDWSENIFPLCFSRAKQFNLLARVWTIKYATQITQRWCRVVTGEERHNEDWISQSLSVATSVTFLARFLRLTDKCINMGLSLRSGLSSYFKPKC